MAPLYQSSLPSLSGKVIFITGGTKGLGKQTILSLLKQSPSEIAFSGRNVADANALTSSISSSTKLTFWDCDLSDIESVRASARDFLSSHSRLDIVICNAGVLHPPMGTSKQGIEITFATNHVGHAALLKEFIPLMQRTAETSPRPKVILLSSDAAAKALPRVSDSKTKENGIDYATLRTDQASFGPVLGRWHRQALAERYPEFDVLSVHPGKVDTPMNDAVGMFDSFLTRVLVGKSIPVEEGVKNTLWAVGVKRGDTDANGEEFRSGALYYPVGKRKDTKELGKEGASQRLWEWTAEVLAA